MTAGQAFCAYDILTMYGKISIRTDDAFPGGVEDGKRALWIWGWGKSTMRCLLGPKKQPGTGSECLYWPVPLDAF